MRHAIFTLAVGIGLRTVAPGPDAGLPTSFLLLPNMKATILFRDLTGAPENLELRAALAKEYRSKGQVGPASFHLAISDLTKRKAWNRAKIAGPIWLCRPETAKDKAAEERVEKLLREGEWGEALASAKKALDASAADPRRTPEPLGNVSCHMAALWAQAAVHAIIARVPMEWSSREMAVRTLIMAVDEIGIVSAVPGWMLLSDYFLIARDTASAYGALAAARDSLRTEPESAFKKTMLEELNERMEPFRRELKLPQLPVQ